MSARSSEEMKTGGNSIFGFINVIFSLAQNAITVFIQL